jgi:DNA polymerase elongation subunit (family B)
MATFYTCVDRYSNDILFRGYKDGEPIRERIQYKPTMYIPGRGDSPYKTLEGRPVEPVNPGTMRETRNFIDEYKDVGNFKIYGNTNYIHQFISDAFLKRGVEFERDKINVTTIDIEVQSDQGFPTPDEARFPITAITVKNNIDNKFYVWGLGEWNDHKSELKKELVDRVVYVQCDKEAGLLMKFLNHWSKNYPDVLTGWNSRLFDTTYIVNRIAMILGEDMKKKLSPWGIINERNIDIAGRKHQAFDVYGIQQLDYMDCFKKFGYTYGTLESYKLDHVAWVVLGERKLSYDEYGSLHALYQQNHQKFIDYNIRDVDIVDRLEDKMGLITLTMTVAYKGLVNYADAFGSVGVWDALLYNELRKRGIVVPPKRNIVKERKIEGAYVKDPQNGAHEWVMSFDLNSLYPHIIMQYNMSPETVIDDMQYEANVDDLLKRTKYDIPKDYCMTGTDQYFDKTKKGIVPEIIQGLYDERTVFKRKMLDTQQRAQDEGETYETEREIVTLNNQQMAVKILMNSLYGALSNEYFRYYDMRVAESITVSGQLTIRWAEDTINNYMNKILKTENEDYVIAIDTDSLYIRMGKLIEQVDPKDPIKFLDKVGQEKLEPLLAKAYDELYEYMNAYEQKMVMAREVIADKGIWTGKKHYALNVYNNEGVQYKEPKLKIMGIEVVRSSTPQPCRDMLRETIKVIMNQDEEATQKFIEECRTKFMSLPAEDIAFPRGVSDANKWKDRASIYKKGTPIHVRGALLYNHHLNKNGLVQKYESIFSGEKIKFCYLKMPNYIQENVIAFNSVIPDEFNIREFVDYDKQFDKAYIEPLKNILDVIGWSTEKRMTLEDFFA